MFPDKKQLERDALAQIRKDATNPYARLHSIAEDARFVKDVHKHFKSYPIIANLRCGAWYTNDGNTIVSHFKSADGHYNGWSFNLRRPNLHIIPIILAAKGCLLVDSTRAGKQMPDSFAKTVPIWCCVVNRAFRLRTPIKEMDWDEQLYCPPQSVSKQEHAEIMKRIPEWVSALSASSYGLPLLNKPLRPIWVTPSSSLLPNFDEDIPFFPVVCLTASKQVENGLERRMHGFPYVQGAGDDHEGWSHGLTPELFWKSKDELLSASQEDLPDILRRIVADSRAITPGALDTSLQSTPIERVRGLISIARVNASRSAASAECSGTSKTRPCVAIYEVTKPEADGKALEGRICEGASPPMDLLINVVSSSKAGPYSFRGSIHRCMDFVGHHLRENRAVCIACESGSDLSVGMAVAALQSFFDDSGVLDHNSQQRTVSKESLRTRLHWIIASRPGANPSRTTLKRVNEFFMSPQEA